MDIPVAIHHNPETSSPEMANHEHKPEKTPDGLGSRTRLIVAALAVAAAGIWLAKYGQDIRTPFGTKTNQPQMTELAMSMQGAAPAQDSRAIAVQDAWITNIADIAFTHAGTLADVSGGSASGTVGTDVITGVYHLYAAFENLPEPAEGFFYEGWVVRKEPISVMSTGALVMHNGQRVNAHLSRTDLLDHDFYVLTLEPDDGNPAPAGHVLEGTIAQKQ